MLDAFEIITTSGVVVWNKSFVSIPPSVINKFIVDVFIEESVPNVSAQDAATSIPTYRKDRHILKWTTAKDVGLVFVAVYQSLLQLSWVDDLLIAVRALFTKQYSTELKKPHLAKIDCAGFDQTFDALIARLDTGTAQAPADENEDVDTEASSIVDPDDNAVHTPPSPTLNIPRFARTTAAKHTDASDSQRSADSTPIATPDTSRPNTPLHGGSQVIVGKTGPAKMSRRTRKALGSSAPVSSGDEGPVRPKTTKSSGKQKRRWDEHGMAIEGDDDAVLDYSAPVTDAEHEVDVSQVDAAQMGNRTGKGQFVLKDLEDEVDAILAASKQQQQKSRNDGEDIPDQTGGLLGTATSKISGLFRNVVGGKTLTKEDLQKPLQQMRSHLLEKNVAREAADRLCTSVETDLLSQKTASFTSIDKTIRESMAKVLTRILTPTSSLDLLRNITNTIQGTTARPYVISVVGVNGVGKSTSLSKIAYFLLQNKFRVLVVAADTFRSGAVEQLRVHVRNLSELSRRENVGTVELFEKGYGKDAATVARDAVSVATNAGKGDMLYDVVLIDTAGRRHNDSRLMSSLTKFGQLANPDKIFMVGEALVGTDSVAQARNFAKEFVDAKGRMRNGGAGMDGFIISKCDTVGDMVGTLVSMVHATGIPVVFLGVGQHYGDLRGLNVGWAVDKLMK